MRISDWSSDVCSSDLKARRTVRADSRSAACRTDRPCRPQAAGEERVPGAAQPPFQDSSGLGACEERSAVGDERAARAELATVRAHQCRDRTGLAGACRAAYIGRASCRERGCRFVSVSLVTVFLKKTNK